jgi:hypothetical protein
MFAQVSLVAQNYGAHSVLMGIAKAYQKRVSGCEIRAEDGYVQVIVPGPGFSTKKITLRLSEDGKTLTILAPARYFSCIASSIYRTTNANAWSLVHALSLMRAFRAVDQLAPVPTMEVRHTLCPSNPTWQIIDAVCANWSIPVGGGDA